MSPAAELLNALMEAVAVRSRSPAGGEGWTEAVAALERSLHSATRDREVPGRESGGAMDFVLHGDEIVLGTQPVWELRGWPWIDRLARSGIRGITLGTPATRSQLEQFVIDLEAILAAEPPPRGTDLSARWGAQGLQFAPGSVPGSWTADRAETDGGREEPGAGASDSSSPEPFPGRPEFELAHWILGELRDVRPLPVAEAEALVRTLAVGMRSGPESELRLLEAPDLAGYPAAHAVNTALLAMRVADHRGETSRRVWEMGLAGLLHDVGMTQLPEDLPARPGTLTRVERDILESHPAVGARILLEGPGTLAIPAVVAYEHHVRVDGGGYPAARLSATPHPASRLVHLTSVYDALRADLPYSEAWDHERALTFIRAGAGGQFDRALLGDFLQVIGDRPIRRLHPGPGVRDGAADGPGEAPAAPR